MALTSNGKATSWSNAAVKSSSESSTPSSFPTDRAKRARRSESCQINFRSKRPHFGSGIELKIVSAKHKVFDCANPHQRDRQSDRCNVPRKPEIGGNHKSQHLHGQTRIGLDRNSELPPVRSRGLARGRLSGRQLQQRRQLIADHQPSRSMVVAAVFVITRRSIVRRVPITFHALPQTCLPRPRGIAAVAYQRPPQARSPRLDPRWLQQVVRGTETQGRRSRLPVSNVP